MPENCDNFKSPKQLGLNICTSDVSCYDGVSLNCIELPSNPDLNDVIAATDAKICDVINLINTISVPLPTIPDDPWVYLTDVDPEITGFNFSGTATEVSSELNVAYKVLSPSHAILKVKAILTVIMTSPELDIDFDFFLGNVQNADSGWFSSGEKVFSSILPDSLVGENFGVPVSIIRIGGDALPTHFEDYHSKGRAGVSDGFVFTQRTAPNTPLQSGEHSFIVEFEIMCRLFDL